MPGFPNIMSWFFNQREIFINELEKRLKILKISQKDFLKLVDEAIEKSNEDYQKIIDEDAKLIKEAVTKVNEDAIKNFIYEHKNEKSKHALFQAIKKLSPEGTKWHDEAKFIEEHYKDIDISQLHKHFSTMLIYAQQHPGELHSDDMLTICYGETVAVYY